MSYARYLKELLRPLGVYRMEGGLGAGELEAVGTALDACGARLEVIQREMLLSTAENEGLERVEKLLARRPVTDSLPRRREALAALLRISGDCFTLAAVNDNLTGCGLNAVARAGELPGTVEVRFPEVPGVPDGFPAMRRIIEDILPCHLEIQYAFWYATWAELEARFQTWADLEALGPTWAELAKMVR